MNNEKFEQRCYIIQQKDKTKWNHKIVLPNNKNNSSDAIQPISTPVRIGHVMISLGDQILCYPSYEMLGLIKSVRCQFHVGPCVRHGKPNPSQAMRNSIPLNSIDDISSNLENILMKVPSFHRTTDDHVMLVRYRIGQIAKNRNALYSPYQYRLCTLSFYQ